MELPATTAGNAATPATSPGTSAATADMPPQEASPSMANANSSPGPQASPPDTAPISLVSGLCMNPAVPRVQGSQEWLAMAEFASALVVELKLEQPALQRLIELWNTLIEVGADEIGDWALNCSCSIVEAPAGKILRMLGVGVTVYDDGEVSFYLQVEGLDTTLWLTEHLDLERVNSRMSGHG